jgi:hypothetical protein
VVSTITCGEVASTIATVTLNKSDFGDAPDSYGTKRASNGPEHWGIPKASNVYIGTEAPDFEIDGQPSNNADGDNNNGINDEDGLGLNFETNGSEITLKDIPVVNNTGKEAYLYGWIDLGGEFKDPQEKAMVTIKSGFNGKVNLAFAGFNNSIKPGKYIVRLRVGTVDSEVNKPTGLASNGEVEDHMICVYPNAVRVADARAMACTGSSVNLNSLIQYDGGTVAWTLPDGKPVSANYTTPNTIGDVIELHYSVSENYCGVDVSGKGKLYLELHKEIDLNSIKKSVVVCVDEAQNINLNTLLGVAVTGEWKPTDDANKKHLSGNRFNGTAAYGSSTGPKEYEFTITPAKGACATGTATVTIKITSEF